MAESPTMQSSTKSKNIVNLQSNLLGFYILCFIARFRFNDLDIGKFDLEAELGGHPYAIVEVIYMDGKGRTTERHL